MNPPIQTTQNPRIFVSHSNADKERFVNAFAEKLRSAGIDAWLDKWELLPGDSLVDKIFEEGLKDAEAVIIVISKNSVESKWVREELNASVVKRIEDNCKLIPVVIDSCDPPAVLKSTLWEKVSNLEDYSEEFDRIVSACLNRRQKPPLGAPPVYSQVALPAINELEQIDKLVLKLAGERLLTGKHISDVVGVKALCDQLSTQDVSEAQVFESVEVLEQLGYIAQRVTWWFQFKHYGISKFVLAYMPEFNEHRVSVCSQIVNQGLTLDREIASAEQLPVPVVQYVMDQLQHERLATISRTSSGYRVYDVTTGLRRSMRS